MTQQHQMKPIAAGLASLGRGGDSMLMHMQPREVAGLQSLAMAHGGSLTINPETGLPEAGFLGDILGVVAPIALGAFLGPAGAGIGGGFFDSALTAGLAVGAGAWALTGDPLKGLSAGLGAYGGAGLGSALGKAGAATVVPAVTPVADLGSQIASSATTAPVLSGATAAPTLGGLNAANLASSVPLAGATPAITANSALLGGTNLAANSAYALPTVGQLTGSTSGLSNLVNSVPVNTMGPPNIVEGLKYAANNPLAFAKEYPMETFAAASPLLSAAMKPPEYQFATPKEDKTPYEGPYYPTERTARFPTEQERQELGSREYQYFTPIHPYPGYEKYDPNYHGYAEGGGVFETPDPDSDPVQDAKDASTYGLGGLASFAPGGEVDYGLSTASNKYTDPNSIPSAAFQAQLDKYNKDLKGLMNPFDNIRSMQPYGPMGTYNPFYTFYQPGLTRAQAEAKLGPAPVWNPAKAFQNQPLQSAPGPASQFQGSGVTSLPQVQQQPPSLNLTQGFSDMATGIMSMPHMAKGGYLDGPGDGMSDSIPATIANKQPARLADGEFVVPADVVSHLGNGSTKAGAQRLYAMMDKVRKARTGTTKQGRQINPNKYLPA